MPARRTRTPEGVVLAQVLGLLKIHGIPAWRNNSGGLRDSTGRLVRFGKVGSADILGVLGGAKFGGRGRFLAVECKAIGKEGTLTLPQWEFLASIHDAGGIALVISDVGRLARILDELESDPGRVYELPPRPGTRGE